MKASVQKFNGLTVWVNPCKGAQNLSTALKEVLHCAMEQGVMELKETKILTVFHDSFKNTPPTEVRMSVGITAIEGLIYTPLKKSKIEACTCVVGNFEIKLEAFPAAWASLYEWLNKNGHRPSGQDPFEIYFNDYTSHPEQKCLVAFYIPIKG